jgi:hypothetical protein
MSTDEYYELTPYAKDLEENWGPAPGNLNSDGQNLVVYGKQFGNVFIGVHPSFGYKNNKMRLLFAKSASLHHGFAAYYTYLEKIFKADAVLHFGTHGSLEFMPGDHRQASILLRHVKELKELISSYQGLREIRDEGLQSSTPSSPPPGLAILTRTSRICPISRPSMPRM